LSAEDKSSIAAQRQATTPKQDAAPAKEGSAEEARKKMITDSQDAWKPKTDK
jgi:hypothetical protein